MTDRRKKFLREKLYELYAQLYKAATPSADFYKLKDEAPWVMRNYLPKEYYNMSKEEQEEFLKTFEYETVLPADAMTFEEARHTRFMKKIDFDAYFLDRDKYAEIVDNFIKDKNNKLTRMEKEGFKTEAYLGCGPNSSEESWRKYRKEKGLDDIAIS